MVQTQVKYIIIAGGDATRWGGYMGGSKHFAVLNGEPIIMRTIRLLKQHGVSGDDIFVVSKDYKIEGVVNYYPTFVKDNHDADKFLNSSKLWNKDGRTVILYGDVYFSTEAMKTIIKDDWKMWRIYCRPYASEVTGTPYGECFAVSFYQHDIKLAKQKLQQLKWLYKGQVLFRIGGWEWARLMAGITPAKVKKHREWLSVYYIIDDETDDIDYPEDYKRLKEILG